MSVKLIQPLVKDLVEDLDSINNLKTNCITKIPQDIKIELNNGTLTLKAGSKVYDGAGNVINITSDIKQSSATAQTFIGFVYNGNSFIWETLERCSSGNTFSSSFSGNVVWYDTANKIVKRSINGGSSWLSGTVSLPFVIITGNGTNVTSIDQVFNGFGYIGNTIFALPNVEGLIPNGFIGKQRNNIKWTTSNVTTITRTDERKDSYFIIDSSGNLGISAQIFTGNIYYDENANKNYNIGNELSATFCGTFSTDSTGRITSFNPKTVFQATDYYDVPKLATNNTFTGKNTFTNETIIERTRNAVAFRPRSSAIDRDTNDGEENNIRLFWVEDKNNREFAGLYCGKQSDGSSFFRMYVFNGDTNSSYGLYNNGSQSFVIQPTPPSGDNSTKGATTNWCYDATKSTNLVHRNSDETISGNKVFNNTIYSTINYRNFQRNGSDGNAVATIETVDSDSGDNTIALFAFSGDESSNANMTLHYNNGRPYASFNSNYTLTDFDKTKKIATTEFVTKHGISSKGDKYVKLGDGTIIQWGKGSYDGTITLPTPFSSSSNYTAIAIDTSVNNVGIREQSTTSFKYDTGLGVNRTMIWIAIGR